MMILLIVQNGTTPVNLFNQEKSDHLVGEGHAGEGNGPVSPAAE
jgi:hypothetical protein